MWMGKKIRAQFKVRIWEGHDKQGDKVRLCRILAILVRATQGNITNQTDGWMNRLDRW